MVPRGGFLVFLIGRGKRVATGLTQGTQVTEAPDKKAQADKPPEAIQPVASSRVTVTLVSLAALLIVGAATANFMPNLDSLSLPDVNRFSLPKFDHFSLPNFNRIASPKSDRVAARSPPKPVPLSDPVVLAALRDIQLSQQQNAAALASLTQDSAAQQTDLKRISRQLSSLAGRVEGLHGAVSPLTTSSIPQTNPRARIIRVQRRAPPGPPPLPKPVGPVSIGGAPLVPAPATSSGV